MHSLKKRKAISKPNAIPKESREPRDEVVRAMKKKKSTSSRKVVSTNSWQLNDEVTSMEKSKHEQPQEELEAAAELEDSDDDEDSQGIVNVDFEFFDPKAEDFHGVKALLRSYLDDTAWDIGGFVDTILAQATVGTVIKTGEDESPIGVVTALNIGRYKDKSCMQSIYQFLKSNCSAKSDATELEAVFEKHPNDVGLLVSERLINIPEELAPPLCKGLFDEILWATEDEPTKALRDSFKFKHYLIMTRVFQQLPKKKKGSKVLKKRKKGDKPETENGDRPEFCGELIYTKPEDELFHELSHWSCKFPVNSEALAAHEIQGLKQFRLVMLLSVEKVELFKSQFCIVEP